MTDATETNFPTKFSYTKEDIEEAAKRDRLGEGYYPFLITDVIKQVSKRKEEPSKDGNMGENPMLVPVCRPLGDANRAESVFGPTIRDYWVLPFANDTIKGHIPPGKWAVEFLSHRLHAVFPDKVMAYPQWNKERKVILFAGEVIEKAEEHEYRKKAASTVYPMAEKLAGDPSPLINCYFWADVYYDEGSDWPSLRGHTDEPPRGAKFGPGMIREGDKITSKVTAERPKASKRRR